MITVTVSHKQFQAEGCSGSYYRVNAQLGVKIGPDSMELLKEFKKLMKLKTRFPGRWPQPYGIVWVKTVGEKGREKGLLMEHIPGKMLATYENTDDEKIEKKFKVLDGKAQKVLLACKRRGISWDDDHGENIMVCRNKIRFIDAEDVYIYKIPKKRKRKL